MPVVVEVDYERDEVVRVVTLPEEIREDRDDLGHSLVYDSEVARRRDDVQPRLHAFSEAQPRWEHEHLIGGSPANWPRPLEWEEGFDLTEADDRYANINFYERPCR